MPENEPVPSSFADPLERMAVYRLAKGLTKPAFKDCGLLHNHPLTVEVAAQLYTAIGSIRANISEGTLEALDEIARGFSNTRLDRRAKALSGMSRPSQ